jgi:glycosyltransferase involved in cell wall biosynthesis
VSAFILTVLRCHPGACFLTSPPTFASDLAISAPRVSVIIPVYGTAAFISTALDSVLGQTYSNFEIIVVNDGSPDSALLERVLEPYRSHITYIAQKHRGCGAARNTAIRAGRGEYVAILDSDDYWHPEYLASHIAVLDADPTVDVVYPDSIWFSADGKSTTRFSAEHPVGGKISFERVLAGDCQIYGGATGRRATFLRAGLYDEELSTGEDFDLWLRVLKDGGRIEYIDRILAYYQERPGSMTSDRTALERNMLRLLDRLDSKLNLSPEEKAILAGQRRKTAARLNLTEGKRALGRGDRPTALAMFSAAYEHRRSWKLKTVILALRIAPRFLGLIYGLRQRWDKPK